MSAGYALAIPKRDRTPILGCGMCGCGCGQVTKLASCTWKRTGTVKGQPNRFVHGHSGPWGSHKIVLAERFWGKVSRLSTDDGCWVWTGYRINGRYGVFGIGSRTKLAHRVAYALEYGDIPCGVVVRHACNNPSCVRPSHLRLGTERDNTSDKTASGTQAVGSRQGSAKLNEEKVKEIRRRYAAGETGGVLAKEYSVSTTVVYLAVQRRTWRHVE